MVDPILSALLSLITPSFFGSYIALVNKASFWILLFWFLIELSKLFILVSCIFNLNVLLFDLVIKALFFFRINWLFFLFIFSFEYSIFFSLIYRFLGTYSFDISKVWDKLLEILFSIFVEFCFLLLILALNLRFSRFSFVTLVL